ncbi:MAG: histidinol dehydrogenase [Actinomycetota bacterium]
MLALIDGRDSSAPVPIPRPEAVRGREPLEDVHAIVQEVRLRGDAALLEFTRRFDRAHLDEASLRVDESTIAKARKLVRPELIDALEVMKERLTSTHERQLRSSWLDRRPDELVGELIRPVRRAGVYVPGGRASYPSTVIMGAVPARVAGVEGIAVASPPDARGEIAEPVLAACAVAGVTEVYRMGGAQAIAALAAGTQTVRPVDKIVGPGNIYVTLAKRLVQNLVGIDTEAGPTEIAVIADSSVPPDVIAADLIAQAEHGPHGAHALITWEPDLAETVMVMIERQLTMHARGEDVENALIEGGSAVLVRDRAHALATANAFAPEHLELAFDGAEDVLDDVRNAGAVFIGPWSPVPVGDYVAGTNHVLPSGGSARWASGLTAGDFMKSIYVSGLERSALERLAPHVYALAEAEGLSAHGRAVRTRLDLPEVMP